MTDTSEERAHLQTIDERDAAEECLSQMFYLVTGRNPEWSSAWGHAEALEEVADAMALLKQTLAGERSRCAKIAEEYHLILQDSPNFRVKTVGECIARAIREGREPPAFQ